MCSVLEIFELTLKNEKSSHRKLWMLGFSHKGLLTQGLHSGRAQSLDKSLVTLHSGPIAPSPKPRGPALEAIAFVCSLKTPNTFPSARLPHRPLMTAAAAQQTTDSQALPGSGTAPVVPNATQP